MLLQTKIHDDIVVYAYTERYVAAVRNVLGWEGGYVNDPVDRGGATKYGISLRFLVAAGDIDLDGDGFADFDLDMDGDIDGQDIRKLTKGDAVYLYHEHFWKLYECESFPRPIGEMLFDQAVNGGGYSARAMLQEAVNICLKKARGVNPRPLNLEIDGRIGDRTRTAIDWVIKRPELGTMAIVRGYREAAAARYRRIANDNPSQQRFLKGWLRRAKHLGEY